MGVQITTLLVLVSILFDGFMGMIHAADVICSGDYYFKTSLHGPPSTFFPSSNIKCDAINGSLSISGFNSSYTSYIPASVQSISRIDGKYEIFQSKLFPSFSKLSQVNTFIISECNMTSTVKLSTFNAIKLGLSISGSNNVMLSFANLLQLGDLNLNHASVSQLDAPKLNEIGSIVMQASQVKTLTGLKNVKKITNDFKIDASKLSSFDMSSLVTIGGSLVISKNVEQAINLVFGNGLFLGKDLIIDRNEVLVEVKKTKGSTNIQGSINLTGYEQVIDLSGLNPANVKNSIIINADFEHVRLFDVSKLTKLEGSIDISIDEDDGDYPVFKELEFIGGDLAIPSTIKQENKTLPQFPKLKKVNGTLIIEYCNDLTNVAIVRSIPSFGSLQISNNNNLLSLEGLEHLTQLGLLKVKFNENLLSLKGLNNMVEIEKDLDISYNRELSSLDELSNIRTVGSLMISNLPLVKSLKCFSSLAFIKGDVVIGGLDKVTSLQGLHNVKSMGSFATYDLRVTSFKDLKSLTQINGAFSFYYLYYLNSVDGLQNLKSVGSLSFGSNRNLKSLKAFSNLIEIKGELEVQENERLKSLDGLSNIKRIKSADIYSNYNLQSLKGLDNLIEVDEGFVISWNDRLRTLQGLDKLARVGSIEFHANGALRSLLNLKSLIEIKNKLWISYNPNLQNLIGLSNVESIPSIYIGHNQNLQNLNGLNKLIKVDTMQIDLYEQTNVKELVIGKQGSDLGHPKIEIDNYNQAKYLTSDQIKSYLSLYCNNIIVTDDTMTC